MAQSPTTDAELQHLYNVLKRLAEFEDYFGELKSMNWTDDEGNALNRALGSTSEAKTILWKRFFQIFSPILKKNKIGTIPALEEAISAQDWHIINFLGEYATSTSSVLVNGATSNSSALVNATSTFAPPYTFSPPFTPPSTCNPPSIKRRCFETAQKWLIGRGSVFAKLGTSVVDLILMVWLAKVMWNPRRIKEKSSKATNNSGISNASNVSANDSTKRDDKQREDENILATRIAAMGLEQILEESVHIGSFP
ncbi:uncharacterized protein LOC110771749 [Prunus avium]|uniref:Uncharacterized protein LOC110771749 n=1 Tax=Prunus avium TaxID=42229 RepID=A0A6P5TYC0_PRUAV|nr:uncharacterized protein LOC110771749 [Prunus avium]